ncbi:MAG: 3-dehydroquinate synthase [Bacteroidales bacterium]|jgi:3-dehydroquinate synthase|nr:3-dehydroquinate synthase [Bacteroidales bacterium]
MLYFDNEAISALKKHIEKYKKEKKPVFILCDDNTETFCLPLLQDCISFPFLNEVMTIPSGEKNKNIETVVYLWQKLLDKNADRNAVLICLGGGMVCDIGGFVSATYKRGINYLSIPTSLMAQIDAGIGGKTAINLNNIKNPVGLFSQPSNIFVIPLFLRTLPQKEILSGFAEMLKHGLIADKTYWEELIAIKDISHITNVLLIEKSIDIKTTICKMDPYDTAERKKLNFGHTIGHALESFALSLGYSLSHGEAIALGMIAESYISCQKKLIRKQDYFSIVNALHHFFPSFSIHESDCPAILSCLEKDKKKINETLNFSLINGIGSAVIDQQVSQEEIIHALKQLQTVRQ